MSNINMKDKIINQRLAMMRSISPENLLSEEQKHKHELSELKLGGVIEYNGMVLMVIDISKYNEANSSWNVKSSPYSITELTLTDMNTGKKWYMDWEIDNELEISLALKELSRSECRGIAYDDGERIDLSDIDEICEKKETLFFRGGKFYYCDDTDMLFNRGEGKDICVNIAEFEDDRKSLWLTIESWTTEPSNDDSWEYDVWLSMNVEKSEIAILSLGE